MLFRTWRQTVGCAFFLLAGLSAHAVDDATCPINAQKVDTCEKCRKFVEKEEIVKGKHKGCDAKLTKTDACVKIYFECESCQTHVRAGGPCKRCGKAMVQKTSKARILYRCPSCGRVVEASGPCKNENCEGKETVKTCEMSGAFPHSRKDPADVPVGKPRKR